MVAEKAPVLTGAAWWALRQQFKKSLPTSVSTPYLSTVLSLQQGPAKQVLRNIKLLGLIDDEDQPTELANRWRDDAEYAGACREILERTYPDELRDAVPGPNPDAAAAARWFRQSRRLGEGAAANAARTYCLIASANLTEEADGGGRATRRAGPAGPAPRQRRATIERSGRSTAPAKTPGGFEMPRPQIAVQVNITPDMTPEQIDQVFASMAKHLYSGAGTE